MDKILKVLILTILIFLTGCIHYENTKSNCPRYYYEYERSKCCLDMNKNFVCDDLEVEGKEMVKRSEGISESKEKTKKAVVLPPPMEEEKPDPKELIEQQILEKSKKNVLKKSFDFYYTNYDNEIKKYGIITNINEYEYLAKKRIDRENKTLKDFIQPFDPMVEDIGYQLLSKAIKVGEPHTYKLVNSFMKSLKFKENTSKGYDDYPKFPLETLIEEEGDSEDASILAASLLINMGYNCVLLDFPKMKTNARFMAVGIECKGCEGHYYRVGKSKFYFLNAFKQTDLGTIPSKLKKRDPEILFI